MKILFYMTRFPGFGGIETVTEIIGNALIDKGYEIILLAHLLQSDRESLLVKRCKCFYMPDDIDWTANDNYTFAERIILNEKIDAIIYQDSYAPTENIVCKLSIEYNIPLFVFEHNTPIYYRKQRDLLPQKSIIRQLYRKFISWPKRERYERNRRRYLIQNSTKYILLANSYISELLDVCGYDEVPKNVFVINNPIQICTSAESVKDNIILFVGRLEPQKGVDKLLHIFSDSRIYLKGWKFIIVGDGSERNKLEKYVYDMKLRNVIFCGFQDPDTYYKKAKLFWMASSYEGWPLTLLEAMSKGCIPVVYDGFSSVTDIIDDGINGFIIDSSKVDSFVKQSLEVIEDESLRESMAYKAILKSQNFEVSSIISSWTKMLEEL